MGVRAHFPAAVLPAALLAMAVALAACGEQSEQAGSSAGATSRVEAGKPPLDLPPEGAPFRVAQRGRTPLPGSNGELRVELGDITGGQVLLVLSRPADGSVLASRSVRAREALAFAVEGCAYELVLERLENHLIGEDFAVLRVRPCGSAAAAAKSAAPRAVAQEASRIERLLTRVAQSDVVFLRNGGEHGPSEAAEHLRGKWKRAGDRIRTAEEFVEALGSRSTTRGEPYRVRLRDGSERDAGPWLSALLAADRAAGR
jgi:hypothetical protein